MKRNVSNILLIGFCVCFCLLNSFVQMAYAQPGEGEDEERLFKAAFIYNFAKFTRWPENTWTNTDSPMLLCTTGKDELVDDLKRLGGKIVQGRPVTIQPLLNTESPENCNLLYIAQSENNRYKSLLKSLNGKPVLTISELPQFARKGGMIKLYREEGRTHFTINLDAAKKSGLEFSSRLLSLAIVEGYGETL